MFFSAIIEIKQFNGSLDTHSFFKVCINAFN